MIRLAAAAALVVALAAGTASAGRVSLHSRIAGTFRVAGVVPAQSTAVVVELPSGRVLFSRNASVSLEPASNEKLAVTYAALAELGASYRFPTQVLGEGRRVGDTWRGRLILKGFGDPTLTSADLKHLVGILHREGIRRVTGGIAGDESAFDAQRVAPGWLASFAGVESPPLSALVVDRAVRGDRVVGEPALAAAARFDQLLRARGIDARGASTRKAGPDAQPLATIYSEPLSEIVESMDHWSDNFVAEMVLKAVGLHALGLGTTAGGAAVTQRRLALAGVPVAGVHVVDGSGLSRDDRVTASELSTLLVKMWNDPTMREIVWNALPVAGQPGTLQHRLVDTPHHTLLRGKTGTTDIASALSGYIGRRFAFVTIENGHPVDYWAAHTAEDGVVRALLAELRGR